MSLLRVSLAVLLLAASAGAALADSPYRDVTLVTWNRAAGAQVEYFDKTSAYTFVWRAGFALIEPGQVLQIPGASGPEALCFRYGPRIREPLGPDSGGFNCLTAAEHERSILDRAKGDVFGLSRRSRAPFRLTRGKTTIEALQGRLGQ